MPNAWWRTEKASMLFNSYEFIFAFLPVTMLGFYVLGSKRRDLALLWLTLASLFFYAWWRPINVLLIAPSILINLGLGRLLERHRVTKPAFALTILIAGIVFNLCFLGYFKYTMFLRGTINDVFGTDLVLTHIILPLGISFITFQKIAFLVDVHSGRVTSFTLRDYALFVLFFPQLIAGPIVHYREMMPQFRAISTRFNPEDAAVGLTLFFMGLAKKLLLADPLAAIVSPLYTRAALGSGLGLIDAWIAALGFTLQIYFDFSGYSDMALGLARFFGIKLPVNFNSPLKATSIIEFWQRWHVSLTRFLTAYIYTPLSLRVTRSRMASGKRNITPASFVTALMVPTMLTMLVSGVWHGAGYTYIAWGLIHGALISINHAWRLIRRRIWPSATNHALLLSATGFIMTFTSVVVAMVMFRAPTVTVATSIWGDMLALHGVALPDGVLARLGPVAIWLQAIGVHADGAGGAMMFDATLRIALLLVIALCLPNSLEILARHEPALGVKPEKHPRWLLRQSQWTESPSWAVGMATVAAAGVLSLGQLSEFLYWQF
jgi:alginate O-acetyltransferase complex protein AlgI